MRKLLLIPAFLVLVLVSSASANHSAPTGLRVTATAADSISLDWTDYPRDPAIREYRVRVYNAAGSFLFDRNTGSKTSGHMVTGLAANTGYRFRVAVVFTGGHRSQFSAQVSTSTAAGSCPDGQYKADYFPNMTLSGSPVRTECDGRIDEAWDQGGPARLPVDGFSARYVGRVSFDPADYEFAAKSDDGVRVWVDRSLIIDEWRDQATTRFRANRAMTAGPHEVKVEYYENRLGAFLTLDIAKLAAPPPSDADGDGVADSADNCPNVSNPAQADVDGDGAGDACDGQDNRDTDGDGVQNRQDQCPNEPGPASSNGCPEAPPPPTGLPINRRVGVNVHMNYGGQYANTAGIAAKLADIGVRLIRDAYPSDHNSDTMPSKWNTFANVDVMAYCVGSWQFSWGWSDPAACVRKFKQTTTRAVAVEGANEPFCNSSAFQQNYTPLRNQMIAIRDEAIIQGLDPYTIGLCNNDRWGTTQIVGMVNNPHSYHSQGYPEYGPASITHSMEWWISPLNGKAISSSGRWGSSEHGTSLPWAGNNQTLYAQYNLVAALNGLKAGLERFAMYLLTDEGSCTNEWGWYDCNGNPRPAVAVMGNLYSVLGNASTGPLSGLTHSVTDPWGTLLSLTARDSTSQYVVLWNRASTATRNVTVNLSQARAVGIIRPMASTVAENRASSTSHTLAMGDDPVILRIGS